MKRLCYVIPSLATGGTEQQLRLLTEGLSSDHEVTVISLSPGGALAGSIQQAGAMVRVVASGGFLGGWDPRLEARLRRVFRRHRPDILHTFLFGFDLPANRAAKATGVPVILSSRRQLATWKKPRHVRIQRKANQFVDCIVANSHAAAEFAADQEGVALERFRVIPNGIAPSAYRCEDTVKEVRLRYCLPVDAPVIGLVANLSPVKDHGLFLATARELLHRREDIHFLLVGDGPRRREVERAIRSAGIEQRFTRVVGAGDMPALYRAMSVQVLCSKAEGCPNALLEGMAAGVPVVATAVGGVNEIVEDGVTGRLVPSRDPKDMADAIESALDDSASTRDMVSRAAEFVGEHYSLAAMTSAYRKLYADLLGHAASTKP